MGKRQIVLRGHPNRVSPFLIVEFEKWLEQQGKTRSTVVSYSRRVMRIVNLLGTDIAETKAVHEWYRMLAKSVSPSACNVYLAAVHAFNTFLVEKHIIPKRATEGLYYRKVTQTLPKPLKEPELAKVESMLFNPNNWQQAQDRLLFEILYGSGLRRSEAGKLLLSNVETKHVIRIVGAKNNSERKTMLTDAGYRYLRDWVLRQRTYTGTDLALLDAKKDVDLALLRQAHPELPIFVDTRGNPVCEHADPGKWVYDRIRKYGVPAHRLRHTWATELLANGADSLAVKDAGGWRNFSTMEGYRKTLNKGVERLKRHHPRQQDSP